MAIGKEGNVKWVDVSHYFASPTQRCACTCLSVWYVNGQAGTPTRQAF